MHHLAARSAVYDAKWFVLTFLAMAYGQNRLILPCHIPKRSPYSAAQAGQLQTHPSHSVHVHLQHKTSKNPK